MKGINREPEFSSESENVKIYVNETYELNLPTFSDDDIPDTHTIGFDSDSGGIPAFMQNDNNKKLSIAPTELTHVGVYKMTFKVEDNNSG